MTKWFFKTKLSEKGLIGIWKHSIQAFTLRINDNVFASYNNEIFKFNANRTFTFGEYSGNNALYEIKGTWRLNSDKTRIELLFDNGHVNSIDVRDYDGKTFIATSIEGNKFIYVKE